MEHTAHHKREVLFLVGFMILFFLIFIIALSDIKRKVPVFGIGLSYKTEDITVMALSFIGIIKVIWHLAFY